MKINDEILLNNNIETIEELDSHKISEVRNNFVSRAKADIRKRKIKKTILSLMAVFMTVTITSTPVVASKIPFVEGIYEELGLYKEYLDYTEYIGKTYEFDGLKITIDNIVGTKYKVLVTIKTEVEDTFNSEEYAGLFIEGAMGLTPWDGSGATFVYPDEKTRIGIYEYTSFIPYAKRGDFNLKVRLGNKINEDIKIPVDFTKSFEKTIDRNTNIKLKELGVTVKEINTTIMETVLKLKIDSGEGLHENFNQILLKVDGKIYESSLFESDDKNAKVYFKDLDFKDFNEDSKISIMPITSNLNIWGLMEEDWQEFNSHITTVNENGITYDKEITFDDNTKGTITKVEKGENTLKFYVTAEDEKKALLLAANIGLYDDNAPHIAYKSNITKDKENSYIIEFKDISSDTKLISTISGQIVKSAAFEIGEELSLK